MFDIVPDVDLDLMRPGQALPDLPARIISGLDAAMAEAVAGKFLPAPLSKEQLAELFQVPKRP